MAETYNTITCPNCGHTHVDTFKYCPSCGQKTEDSIISFKEMFLDLLGAFFSFDSKAIRSVPKLLFIPGSLTNEYIAGKRAAYLAPFRLYLFVSIVLFLVLPLVVSDRDLFNGDIADLPETLDSLMEVAADQEINGPDTNFIPEGLEPDSLPEETSEQNNKKVNWTVNKEPNRSVINFGTEDTSELNAWNRSIHLAEEGMPPKEVVDSIFKDQGKWAKRLLTQGVKLQANRGEGLISAFLDKASYTLFIFLPIFALFLKLLYIRRKRYYIEHLIFSLHYFSFFFLLIILYVLIYKFLFHIPFWIVPSIALVYLYISMIRVYRQRWGRTLFKWITLNLTTAILFLPIFFIIALAISLLFY